MVRGRADRHHRAARWRVTNQVLVAGARQVMADRDGSPREPLLRLRGTCLGGSFRLTQSREGPPDPRLKVPADPGASAGRAPA
jgi:hypothetical protein